VKTQKNETMAEYTCAECGQVFDEVSIDSWTRFRLTAVRLLDEAKTILCMNCNKKRRKVPGGRYPEDIFPSLVPSQRLDGKPHPVEQLDGGARGKPVTVGEPT